MAYELPEFEKKVIRHFKSRITEHRERELLLVLLLTAKEDGLQDEYERFVEENPDASVDDFAAYAQTLWNPPEIVDDDELSKEEL